MAGDPLFGRGVRRRRLLLFIGLLFASLLAIYLAGGTNPRLAISQLQREYGYQEPTARNTVTFSNGTVWQKPLETKIVAVVFYGRRQFVDILDCYLRRNLRIHGGILDEVQFLMHTNDEIDKQWLRQLMEKHKLGDHYILREEETSQPGWSQWGTYANLYKLFMTDPDTIYIKMDDDVMFVDDHALPEMIRATLEHPDAYAIMANIVNNKRSHWFHHAAGAIWPYLPDRHREEKWPLDSWRPSELPRYQGRIPEKDTQFYPGYPPPFNGHRWLPLHATPEAMQRTPFSGDLPWPDYVLHGKGVGWSVAAQAHYSLFENLERRTMGYYHFGAGLDKTFNLWYMRWNINFLAIRGSNIARRPFWGAHAMGEIDEVMLTSVIPKELDMPTLVATRAVVSHYSFKGDRENVLKTDILDRYRAYANENVCARGNRKKPFGKRRNDKHHFAEQQPDAEEDDIRDGPGDVENAEGNDSEDKVADAGADQRAEGQETAAKGEESPAPAAAAAAPVGVPP